MSFFKNRSEAGRLLAERLSAFKKKTLAGERPLMLALPRGGVPVAHEIAQALGIPWDVLVVRKIGAPGQPEFGIGAVTEDRIHWVDHESALVTGATPLELNRTIRDETDELNRRVREYRGSRRLDLRGREVLIVDDGLATGVSARLACRYARAHGAKRVTMVVPSGFPQGIQKLEEEADEVICLVTSNDYFSVSQFYAEFPQVSDSQVIDLLADRVSRKKLLGGDLEIPIGASGIVIFAHGSGSSRKSPRNQRVAEALRSAGLGTFLFDLLSSTEAEDRELIFDIPLLARRLKDAFIAVHSLPEVSGLPIGFFGASTGAAAALWASAELGSKVTAVVSRGGRPDLAFDRLDSVQAPTLLIVGGDDLAVKKWNEEASREIRSVSLVVIPGATHLFEEPGALDRVAQLAADWFSESFAEGKKAA